VIKETNAGFIVINTGTIQINLNVNIGLGRFAGNLGGAHGGLPIAQSCCLIGAGRAV